MIINLMSVYRGLVFHANIQKKKSLLLFSDMSQFGLSGANSHWSYSSAGPYSPYLTGSGLSSCTTPTAAQFNNPALGFTCSSTEQGNGQDFSGSSRDCVPSKCHFS